MGVEQRAKAMWKREKNYLYGMNGGQPDPEGVNRVFLYIAKTLKVPVKTVKDAVNPGGYFG